MGQGPFISDIKELRRRARQHIEKGAVTEGYKVDRETALKLLNEALATEIVCVLRYKRHYYAATGSTPRASRRSSSSTPTRSSSHADQISERITQLGGEPNLNPEGMLDAQPLGVRRGRDARRDDQGGPRGRAHRHRELLGDDPLLRRRRSDVAAADGGDPGEGRRARQRSGRPLEADGRDHQRAGATAGATARASSAASRRSTPSSRPAARARSGPAAPRTAPPAWRVRPSCRWR